ncbi:spore coat protein YlbD [Bacillus aerolatus]|uniref:spore coat protein YlbD n=1 Tax=Bacillus aerolatus TaxID=2653354 RepID=UPI001786A57C|nr:spore coat protein YlbD [Bacillus aerolatus]
MKNHSLHPHVEEFKEFMKGRPDLKRMVQERHTTLQELFEEWHRSGDVVREEGVKKDNEAQSNGFSGDWFGKLIASLSSFDGEKWNSIVSDMQGMLEMAQIYLADLVEKQSKESKKKDDGQFK